VCAAGEDNTEEVLVLIEDLLAENPELFDVLEYAVPSEVLCMKLSAAFKEFGSSIKPQEPAAELDGLVTCRAAEVLNTGDVCAAITEAVRTAQVSELCLICCRVCPITGLVAACGRCEQRACETCMRAWYTLQPGMLPVPNARLRCPFCRLRPEKLAQYCPRRNLPRGVLEEDGMVLGYCGECRRIRGAVERECVHGAVEAQEGWTCFECREAEQLRAEAEAALQDERQAGLEVVHGRNREDVLVGKQVKCPGCGVSTVKDGGCDHMHCPVCEAHWCWQCRNEFNAENIYAHIDEVHGGHWF
jgi:hypothetical protein